MIFKRRCTWLLTLLLAVPLAADSRVAAQNQGEEGAPRGQMGAGGRRGSMSLDDRLKQMKKDLDLTADQLAKIKPVLEAERKKMQDLMNPATVNRQTMRSKILAIQQETRKQIRDLLDDKQKELFDKQQEERPQRMRERRGIPGGPSEVPPPPQN